MGSEMCIRDRQYGKVTAQEPQSRLTVVFDGKEYSGKYDHTVVNSLGMCTNHIYQGDDLFFSIDATNGELTSIHFVYRFVDSEISDELLVSCRNEAQRIAEQYIDTSYFVLEEKNEHELGMSFIYTQFVGGMKTENHLQVSFNGQGNLDTFNIYVSEGYKLISQEGVDDTAKLVETLSSKAAEQTALNKAKSAFADIDVKKYEIREPKLYVMPDGKLVMAYSFVAEITNNNPIRDESGNLLYSHKSAWLNVAVFEQ